MKANQISNLRRCVVFGVIFASSLALSNPAKAGEATGEQIHDPVCDSLKSEPFRQAVLDTFGRETALNKTSFGLYVIDRGTGGILCDDTLQQTQLLYPASSIKTLIAIAVLRKVDRKEIGLNDLITIDQSNAAAECSDWDCGVYGPGKTVSVQQLIYDMITISNNLATNQLIDVAGKDWINQTADDLDAPDLRVYRKVYNSVDPEPGIKRRNTASAQGLMQLYREIATARLHILSEPSRALLIDIFKHQHYHDSFDALFPASIPFYHKPGETSTSVSDGGYFELDDKTIVVLSGLEGFHAYRPCPSCSWHSGITSFQTLGKTALKIVLNH